MSAIDFPNTPNVGDQYTVDNSTWIWTGVSWDIVPGIAVSTVSSLLDVTLTGLTNGDILTYNEATSKWVNQNLLVALAGLGVISSIDGGLYDTPVFAATIDGGQYNTTQFNSAIDGGE